MATQCLCVGGEGLLSGLCYWKQVQSLKDERFKVGGFKSLDIMDPQPFPPQSLSHLSLAEGE